MGNTVLPPRRVAGAAIGHSIADHSRFGLFDARVDPHPSTPMTAPLLPDPSDPDRQFPIRRVLAALGALHGAPRRVVVLFVVISSVSGALEAMALILFTSGALRATGGGGASTEIGPLSLSSDPAVTLLVAAVATLLAAALHALQARIATDGSLRVLVNARHRIAASFLRAKWSTQAEQRDGSLHNAMFNLAQQASIGTVYAAGVFNDLVIMVALIVVALLVAPVFTLVLFASIVPLTLLLAPITRRARRRAQESVGQADTLSEDVATTNALALELQAFGVADAQLARLDEANAAAAASLRSGRFSGRLASYWFKDFALLMFIVVVGVIDLVWDLTQAAAAAAILLVIRTLGYAQQSYNAYHHVVETGPAVLTLEARLADLDTTEAPRTGNPVAAVGRISFDGVGYRYPNGRVALDDVSFTIEPGRVLGIVGRSGAGKSTLAELLLRLREPTSGRMLVDGADATALSLDDWRRVVTIVPQDPRVQRASIADNIVFLREGYSRADVEAAARASLLHGDVAQFDDGYDTVLGSSNRGLSGGQRQRLAIARALISKPSLLVLDEPTSALDRQSEGRLQETLRGLKSQLTMVIIAHRLSTLDLCDDLLLLDGGRVVAFGDRESIMRSERFFTSLPADEPGDV
jgi:ATP-binding cassette, subfamily B, bacterial